MIGIDDGIDDGWELMKHGGGYLTSTGQRQTSPRRREGKGRRNAKWKLDGLCGKPDGDREGKEVKSGQLSRAKSPKGSEG